MLSRGRARMMLMNLENERRSHAIFRFGVVIKAIQTAIELVLGFVLIFFNYHSLYQAALFLTGDELTETQTNPIWLAVIHFARGFAATPRAFWAFLFISHAAVKLFLIWGLLKEKLWSYPLSAGIFGLFILSQLQQTYYTPSLALWLVTIFDAVLIVLILHEYKEEKKSLAGV
jgi:uncharacterized membrane protein